MGLIIVGQWAGRWVRHGGGFAVYSIFVDIYIGYLGIVSQRQSAISPFQPSCDRPRSQTALVRWLNRAHPMSHLRYCVHDIRDRHQKSTTRADTCSSNM